MARPYSQDLRERVVSCVASGSTCREAAARFGVGVATAVRWSHRHRTTGAASARPMGGCRRAVLAGERDGLLGRIAETPDLTLRAIVGEPAARDVRVSYDAVWRFYEGAGMTFESPRRLVFIDVFIDETWAKPVLSACPGRQSKGRT